MKIYIINQHQLLAHGLRHLLISENFEVQSIYTDINECVGDNTVECNSPALCIFDVRRYADDLSKIRQLRIKNPAFRLIAYSMYTNSDVPDKLINYGVDRFLFKGDDPILLLDAIRDLMSTDLTE